MPEMKRVREAQVVYQTGVEGDREPVAMLPIANLGLRLTAQLVFADDQWSAYCPELDVAAAADTRELAIHELVQLAVEYASEYLSDFDLYVNSANRSAHLSYILSIARYTIDPDDAEALKSVRQLFVEQGWAV